MDSLRSKRNIMDHDGHCQVLFRINLQEIVLRGKLLIPLHCIPIGTNCFVIAELTPRIPLLQSVFDNDSTQDITY